MMLVQSLGWENPLEKGIFPTQGLNQHGLENPMEQRSLAGYTVHGVEESDKTKAT